MRLEGRNGDVVELTIAGYQFPDADDPRQRYSWHVVEGRASCREGSWTFSFPALTCEESGLVSPWLRRLATSPDPAAVPPRRFVEPNLALSSAGAERGVEIAFDLEFRPPWHGGRGAGRPFRLVLPVTSDQLMAAASAWDAELAAYPDRSSGGGR